MSREICLVGGEDVHKRIPLSQYLIEAGFKVTIIGTSSHTFPDNVTYVPYNLNRRLSPYSDYMTLKWYQRFFTENEFDCVHSFDTKPNFLLPLALLKNKTPVTRTITGLGTIFMSNSTTSKFLRRLYFNLHYRVRNKVYKTVFQNTSDRDLFLKHNLINGSNHKMIYSSGIDLKQVSAIAQRKGDPFTFICVARLVYEKGIINLLEAARICHDKGYKFKFLLVGPLEENTKRLNKNILDAYSDVVEALGSRTDVFSLLQQSDAFVLPTFREGFARVLLEAAAVGLPIISTKVPGVVEFATHNKEALLVPPNDSEALSNAMITIMTDKPLADKLAKTALKSVEQFDLKEIANKYITIFKSVN